MCAWQAYCVLKHATDYMVLPGGLGLRGLSNLSSLLASWLFSPSHEEDNKTQPPQFQVSQLICQHSQRDLRRKRKGVSTSISLLSSEGLRKPQDAASHRKAVHRFSSLQSLETEKMKHLKLDFSLVTSKHYGWSKPAGARVRHNLRTWNHTSTLTCACVHVYIHLRWGGEPCHCFISFCHELESALALSYKAFRRLTVVQWAKYSSMQSSEAKDFKRHQT